MKAKDRVELHMFKTISNGRQIDQFTQIVAKADKDAAKKKYEQMGYKVTVVHEW